MLPTWATVLLVVAAALCAAGWGVYLAERDLESERR